MRENNLIKLKRQLKILEEITFYNWDQIRLKYNLSKAHVRNLYYKSKNIEKMNILRIRIEEKENAKEMMTDKEINSEVKRVIIEFENNNRDFRDICKFLNRSLWEIEKVLGRRYKNKSPKVIKKSGRVII